MLCIALHCIALHCIALLCIALHGIALQARLLHCRWVTGDPPANPTCLPFLHQANLHYCCRRDKSWHLTLGREMKPCVSLGTCDISTVNCHTSALKTPSKSQMFTGSQRKAYFFSRKKGGEKCLNCNSQLLSHVCSRNAIRISNAHISPAGSILFFTSQGG